jgi:1-acyl-sn-glycerol-3-phosphate acyltransferase
MITAEKSRLINRLFGFYLARILRKHFYRINISGEENFISASMPVIIYANHTNWWDGFVAYFLTSKLWKKDDYLIMDIKQMKTYSFFKYLGVFSIDNSNANETLKAVNYAAALLKNKDRCLWIFPQGEMEVQDKQPLIFRRGIEKIAEKTGTLSLIPAAFRYEFINEQRPEIFIKIGEPIKFSKNETPAESLSVILQNRLENELGSLKKMVQNKSFKDFNVVFRGKESRNKIFD